MIRSQTKICLYPANVSDLNGALNTAIDAGYDMVICSLTHQLFARTFDQDNVTSERHRVFTRSDILLTASNWRDLIIHKLTDSIDCDSVDERVRKHSEHILHQEMSWAKHLATHAVAIYRPQLGPFSNLAKCLAIEVLPSECVLIELSLEHPKFWNRQYRKRNNGDKIDGKYASNDVWRWWDQFRCCADYTQRIKVVLELSRDSLYENEIQRWLGEPVEMIVLPSDLFQIEANGSVSLPGDLKQICRRFVEKCRVHFAIRCDFTDDNLRKYSEWVEGLLAELNPFSLHGDRLMLLTPLSTEVDLLRTGRVTFGIGNAYYEAIKKALIHKTQEYALIKTINVLVVGFGSCQLVSIILRAAVETRRRVKVFVYEENVNVVILMESLFQSEWPDEDIEILPNASLRNFKSENEIDICISPVFDSSQLNQSIQHNFERVKEFLNEKTTRIPSGSTLLIQPIMSSKLFNKMRDANVWSNCKKAKSILTHSAFRSGIVYNIFPENFYACSNAAVAFSFDYENQPEYNEKFASMQFSIKQDCVVNGFFGHFEADLFNGINLRIHSDSQDTLPSIFFPLGNPQRLRAGDELLANFWLCNNQERNKFWYEWSTKEPFVTRIYNSDGKHFATTIN